MNQPLVEIKNLSKIFGKNKIKALDAINAEFSFGKIIGLVGPDGAGKTTLIRIMAGLLTPTSGSVKIAGIDSFKESDSLHQIISYMPQKFGLYEDLTVMENLVLYADLQSLTKEEKEERFEKLLHFTGLKEFTARLAGDLSGGMKQKLGLACTLLRRPKFLLLDEPSVGVDPISRRELWEMTLQLTQENISVLWSTAYLDEAEKCSDVLLLNEGKMLYFGPPRILTERVNHRTFQIQQISEDRRLVLSKALQDPNVLDGVIQGSAVRLVVKNQNEVIDIRKYHPGENAILQEVPPRFEDAFIDILGGGPGGSSPLSKITPTYEKEDKPIVEAHGLTKNFGNFIAADQVSFSVKRGEIFGLLGPNGAGKSTTFKMLCGLLPPTSGHAVVAGYSLERASSQARGNIGYMAQKFSLYGNMTVLQNLKFFHGIYSKNSTANNIIEKMITMFSFSPYLQTPTSELPLGFKQRLSLACAIMHQPEVLFLDEPTSGVDPITRREFWNHINVMVEKGVAIIVTTHFMDEAQYCDRIGLINHGKLIMIDTPDNLKEKVRSKELPFPTLEDAFIILSSQNKETLDASAK